MGRLTLAAVLAAGCCLLAPAQTAVLQIRVLEGEGAVQPAGSRTHFPVTVVVTDEIGKPVEGVVVTFRLPESGPTGLFANGLKTDLAVTGADGRAAASSIRWDDTIGAVHIRLTALKDQVRAGMVVSQYVAGEKAVHTSNNQAKLVRAGSRWRKITFIVAGAAAAGFALGWKRGSSQAGAGVPDVTIGQPTIEIGGF